MNINSKQLTPSSVKIAVTFETEDMQEVLQELYRRDMEEIDRSGGSFFKKAGARSELKSLYKNAPEQVYPTALPILLEREWANISSMCAEKITSGFRNMHIVQAKKDLPLICTVEADAEPRKAKIDVKAVYTDTFEAELTVEFDAETFAAAVKMAFNRRMDEISTSSDAPKTKSNARSHARDALINHEEVYYESAVLMLLDQYRSEITGSNGINPTSVFRKIKLIRAEKGRPLICTMTISRMPSLRLRPYKEIPYTVPGEKDGITAGELVLEQLLKDSWADIPMELAKKHAAVREKDFFDMFETIYDITPEAFMEKYGLGIEDLRARWLEYETRELKKEIALRGVQMLESIEITGDEPGITYTTLAGGTKVAMAEGSVIFEDAYKKKKLEEKTVAFLAANASPVILPGPSMPEEPEKPLLDRASVLFKEKRFGEAFEIWLELAEKGSADAQNNAAVSYRNGEGVEKNDELAVFWYGKAAEQGHVKAMTNLGICYKKGAGVERDADKAVALFRRAAEMNHPAAANSLAIAYEEGLSVEKDAAQALKWFRRAAELGHAYAPFAVYEYLRGGIGEERNFAEALLWCRVSAARGNSDAQAALKMEQMILMQE